MKNINKRRILMSVAGTLICAVSVGIFKEAAFGVDPFQSLMSGMDTLIPISFGTLYVIVNAILLIFSFLTDKSKIGLGTFINLFLYGYIAQFVFDLLRKLMPQPGIIVRAACLATATVTICFGSALYMVADLGVSPYDAIPIVLAEKWKIAPFKYTRMGCDIICVLTGVLLFILSGEQLKNLTGQVGAGTIITAFFMGPLIEWFRRKAAVPLLNKPQRRNR